MSNYRLASNHEFFLRDLLRDYCTVYLAVDEQVRRFRRDGNVSYTVLNTLLGESSSKGVFWRLKDTAHYLFRNEEGTGGADYAAIGRLVDWCIGYAFHECCKLREDAFQGQHYAMRLMQLSRADQRTMKLAAPLEPLGAQTAESCERELNRILNVLREGMRLLVLFLPSASDNCSLARWLVTQQERVRQTFQDLYPQLVHALYEDCPQRMFTLAAVDFMDCGRTEEARFWLGTAREMGSLDEDGARMLHALDSVRAQTGSPS
ncbi:MAG: hypothetical protein Q4F72_00135 [Desulfovibrionaceae bacterium]|nr:hypothetical protein [Desulfovibrionaceae bacterium]